MANWAWAAFHNFMRRGRVQRFDGCPKGKTLRCSPVYYPEHCAICNGTWRHPASMVKR